MTTLSIRPIVFTALFAALYIAMSAITIPMSFSPVPFTLQNLAVMLAGALLGGRYGFFSIAVVLLLTAAGLPLLHGNGGLAYILGPTGGFLLAFPFCALLIGLFTRKLIDAGIHKRNRTLFYILLFVIFELFGSLASYVLGVPWLSAVANISLMKSFAAYCVPYLPGDAAKAVIAAIVTGALLPHMPKLAAGTKPQPRQAPGSSSFN